MSGWQETKWCRVVDSEGKLWCETSSEKEARERMRDGDKLQRLYAKNEYEWRDVEDDTSGH